MVDLEEIIIAFKELGIDIDRGEATKLLERYELLILKIPLIYTLLLSIITFHLLFDIRTECILSLLFFRSVTDVSA